MVSGVVSRQVRSTCEFTTGAIAAPQPQPLSRERRGDVGDSEMSRCSAKVAVRRRSPDTAAGPTVGLPRVCVVQETLGRPGGAVGRPHHNMGVSGRAKPLAKHAKA